MTRDTSTLPALTGSRALRFAVFTALYVAQGIPLGLLDLALPAWLAEQGYSATQVGAYVAIIGLPWAFKLVAGPFMDRFGFPAMGRRRPWVLFAQSGLVAMLLVLALWPDVDAQLSLLMTLAVAVNSFAATQDVAVDGMAINVLPVQERGRANAFMAFGQISGFAGMGALSGTMLATFGLPATAAMAAMLVALILLMALLIREREGEKLLPWSEGAADPRFAQKTQSVVAIFSDLRRSLLLPMSLLFSVSVFMVRITTGIFLAALPIFAVQELGFSAATYSEFYGALIGLSALIGLAVGPLIDRVGAKRVMTVGLLGSSSLLLTFAATSDYWHLNGYVLSMWFSYLVFEQFLFIAVIAQYMNLTWEKIAASQFAIYMALANLGRSGGAALFAMFAGTAGGVSFQSVFLFMGGFLLLAALVLRYFSEHAHRLRLKELDPQVSA